MEIPWGGELTVMESDGMGDGAWGNRVVGDIDIWIFSVITQFGVLCV